ncbi:DUF6505 family protein [Stappia indica]|uniref:DUF6505 family protein n=1 Tax=Stappia indica TaxID=538381 RepID=UPI001CD27166|nr:DUF6505 family protein [Stappia indica]MCA1297274.1 DUF6505 family protein [Stappia indica]
MARLLKAIRLDESDTQIFPEVAEPGDWVIPGTFAFRNYTPEGLTGQVRQAFAFGFLSLGTFGWTTLATPAEISDEERDRLVGLLADHFVAEHGAPSREAALPVAEAEIADAMDIASGLEDNDLLTILREIDDDGAVHERFEVVTPPEDAPHARIWDVDETE